MPAKRKAAAARKAMPSKRARAPKATEVAPLWKPSPEALRYPEYRLPEDVFYKIFKEMDIVTATTFGVTCKVFRRIYIKDFRKVFDKNPVPAIPLDAFKFFREDQTYVSLLMNLKDWMGPDRQWNPFTNTWCNPRRTREVAKDIEDEIKEAQEEKLRGKRDRATKGREQRRKERAEERHERKMHLDAKEYYGRQVEHSDGGYGWDSDSDLSWGQDSADEQYPDPGPDSDCDTDDLLSQSADSEAGF